MMLKIGYRNSVRRDLIESILDPVGSSMKRLRDEHKERGMLIDATSGRKTRSMIVTTTGKLYLSAFQPETLEARMNQSNTRRQGRSPTED